MDTKNYDVVEPSGRSKCCFRVPPKSHGSFPGSISASCWSKRSPRKVPDQWQDQLDSACLVNTRLGMSSEFGPTALI
jgi:hypothetical protein